MTQYRAHVEILKATPELCCMVADNMRESDTREMLAAGLKNARASMAISVRLSHEAFVGMADGEPACVFGIGYGSLISQMARPWMIGTPEIESHQFAFLRRNKAFIKAWAQEYGRLENMVDARHTASLRWVRWLGFHIHPAVPFGPYALPFHPISLTASDVATQEVQ